MHRINQILLALHFIGLAMGFAVTFANIAMAGLMAKAAPPDKAVLGRFPPIMSAIGRAGIALLWATGLTMVFTKYGGFGNLPRSFLVKMVAVVLLSAAVGYITLLEKRVHRGDMAAVPRIAAVGRVAALLGLIALVFAVLTFD